MATMMISAMAMESHRDLNMRSRRGCFLASTRPRSGSKIFSSFQSMEGARIYAMIAPQMNGLRIRMIQLRTRITELT